MRLSHFTEQCCAFFCLENYKEVVMWLFLIGFIIVLLVVAFSIFALSSNSIILYILAFIMLSIGLIVAGGFLTCICVMIVNVIALAVAE